MFLILITKNNNKSFLAPTNQPQTGGGSTIPYSDIFGYSSSFSNNKAALSLPYSGTSSLPQQEQQQKFPLVSQQIAPPLVGIHPGQLEWKEMQSRARAALRRGGRLASNTLQIPLSTGAVPQQSLAEGDVQRDQPTLDQQSANGDQTGGNFLIL